MQQERIDFERIFFKKQAHFAPLPERKLSQVEKNSPNIWELQTFGCTSAVPWCFARWEPRGKQSTSEDGTYIQQR